MRAVFAMLAGSLFGAGLIVSQMTNPAKVIAFLDIFGDWDPSLAFVMGGALLTSAIGYRVVLRRRAPFVAETFRLPTRTDVDPRLISGAALFGVGWGLVGLCPGPALASVLYGGLPIIAFLAAMLLPMILLRRFGL